MQHAVSTDSDKQLGIRDRVNHAIERSLRGTRFLPAKVGVLSFIALLMLTAMWSLTTPVAGSPDEPHHAVKAAGVVRGQGYGISHDDAPIEKRSSEVPDAEGKLFAPPNFRYFEVPELYALLNKHAACFAFKADQTPTCEVQTAPLTPDKSDIVVSRASLYDPTFYALVGWPSLLHEGYAGFYGMRLANALLTSACFALGFAAVSRLRSATLLIAGFALIATPSAVFLGGTVNPNGLEIALTATFAAALLSAVENRHERRQLWWLMSVVALMGVLQPHIRSLGFIWLGVAVVAVALLVTPRVFFDLLRKPATIFAATLTLVSILLALWQLTSTSVLTATVPMHDPGATFLEGFRLMLERIGHQTYSMVALFGWIDTPGPEYIVFLYTGLVFVLVVGAIALSRAWQTSATWFAIAAYVFLPAVIQGVSMANSGFIWQGRYSMALFSTLILLAAAVVQPYFARFTSETAGRLETVFALSVGAIHLVSFYTALRRYAVGTGGRHGEFLSNPAWLPPYLPFSAPGWVVLLAIVSLFYALCLLLMMRVLGPTRKRAISGSSADTSESSLAETHASPPVSQANRAQRPLPPER